MKNKKLFFVCILIILLGMGILWLGLKQNKSQVLPSPMPTSSDIINFSGDRELVERVIDGDTIVLQNGKTVRLLGIDTPETVDPRRPVGCFGKEASNETKSLLSEKWIILQKDIEDTDKYNRELRYIFLPLDSGQILFVNDFLVREGFAKTDFIGPTIKYQDQFTNAQDQAKLNKKGLWGRC